MDKGRVKPILAQWVSSVTTGRDEHEIDLDHYYYLRVIARRGTVQSVAIRLCLSRPKAIRLCLSRPKGYPILFESAQGYPIMFESAQGYPIMFESAQSLYDYV